MSKKLMFIIFIAIIAALFWYKWGARTDKHAQNKKPPALVKVIGVIRKDMPIEFETVGTVVPTQTVSVRSRLDSQIKAVRFHDGDFVKKDELLFILDDNALSAQLRGQEANLERDKAQLNNLEQQYKRNQELVKNDFASAAELDDSKAAYDAQKATVNATAAAVQNLRVQIEYTKIKAPIGGRTGTINVTVGNNVKANDVQALVIINQVKPIRIQFSLPQTYLGAVRQALNSTNIDIYIKQDNAAEPLKGRLEYIDNAVDLQTNTFIVRSLFDNSNEVLWPGMFVNAIIRIGEESQVLVAPEEAIQHGQDQDYVFIIVNNTAKKIAVKTERVQNGVAIIQSGLNEGDQVVIDGILSINDGDNVNTSQQNEVKKDQVDKPNAEKPLL